MTFGAPTHQKSKVTTRSAPIKGINALDSITSMPEGSALILRNFYAQPYGCQVRRGFRKHAVGLLGDVESLCSHNVGVGGDKLYGFVNDAGTGVMYDVTVPMGTPVQVKTGLTNARWQHVNFPNAAGVNLVAVNGADDLIWIQPNGSIVSVTSGSGAGNTISGVNPRALIHVYAHQKRLWFVEKDTTYGWYMPPDQITGVAKSFNFGPIWTRGGSLIQIITWTIDDGNGADDHLAAISSQGEVAIYQGTDPEGADTWSLQGVYYAGSPIGRRPACRYGGDILMVTQFGIVYLSDLLKSTKVNPSQDNTAKYIQQLVAAAISLTGKQFGWQPFLVPSANMLMVNVPATRYTSFQFVMNDITKAWSQFIGYEAHSWELHQNLPFFGGNGAVYRAWEGTTDDASIDPNTGIITRGADIRAEAQTSFSYFDSLGAQKHYKMIRPTILSSGEFSINFSVNTDFTFDSPLAPAAFNLRDPGRWDQDNWDAVNWEGGVKTFKTWQAVTGIGTAASMRLLMRSSEETYWASTDWVYELGGIM